MHMIRKSVIKTTKKKYRVLWEHVLESLVWYRDEFEEIFPEAMIYEMRPDGWIKVK